MIRECEKVSFQFLRSIAKVAIAAFGNNDKMLRTVECNRISFEEFNTTVE